MAAHVYYLVMIITSSKTYDIIF